eukprot:455845-Hanusia_phi.AAC.2
MTFTCHPLRKEPKKPKHIIMENPISGHNRERFRQYYGTTVLSALYARMIPIVRFSWKQCLAEMLTNLSELAEPGTPGRD